MQHVLYKVQYTLMTISSLMILLYFAEIFEVLTDFPVQHRDISWIYNLIVVFGFVVVMLRGANSSFQHYYETLRDAFIVIVFPNAAFFVFVAPNMYRDSGVTFMFTLVMILFLGITAATVCGKVLRRVFINQRK